MVDGFEMPLNGRSPHEACALMYESGEMLTDPRNGQSIETINTTTRAKEVATAVVITRCSRKSGKPNRYVKPVVSAPPKNMIHHTTLGIWPSTAERRLARAV